MDSTWWAFTKGLGQGVLNTVNGLQDSAIGLLNLPAEDINTKVEILELLNILPEGSTFQIPLIPSPDWSRGKITEESDNVHGWSKYLGAGGVETLTGVVLGKLSRIKKALDTVDKVDDARDASRGAGLGKPQHSSGATKVDTDDLSILNSPQCFAPETPVATPDGPRPIGEIRRGDTVLAYDHRSGTWSERSVEGFHENIYDGPLFTVHTESGTVRTTIYHPFWVLSGYDLEERQAPRELEEREDQGLSLPGRWVNSHELCCGDVLIGQNGEQRTVLRVEQEFASGFLVHNLTISEDHTFAVGPDAILVHNTGGCGDGNIIRHVRGDGKHLKGLDADQLKSKINDVRDNFQDMADLGRGRKIYRKGDTVLIEDGAGGGTIFEPTGSGAKRYFDDFVGDDTRR